MGPASTNGKRGLSILELLRPHKRQLWLGLLAIGGESIADLLEPWPLKIVLDNVLHAKTSHGWLYRLIRATAGTSPLDVLIFACAAVLLIALMDAVCTYAEKYLTTSVGQWVTHDLRRAIYTQVQKLSLAYHDQQPTGDLISRVTSDIDSIQTFIVSGLLGILVNILTLVGMVVRDVLCQLAVHADRAGGCAAAVLRRVHVYAAGQEGLARGKKTRRPYGFDSRGSRLFDSRCESVRA